MNASANYRVLLLRLTLLGSLAAAAGFQLGCETRVIGARGPGAGFYQVEKSDLRDSNDNVYGESGLAKK